VLSYPRKSLNMSGTIGFKFANVIILIHLDHERYLESFARWMSKYMCSARAGTKRYKYQATADNNILVSPGHSRKLPACCKYWQEVTPKHYRYSVCFPPGWPVVGLHIYPSTAFVVGNILWCVSIFINDRHTGAVR